MKPRLLLPLLALLAILCGYLLSKASLVGKAGMTFVYKEYAFLKTWWQGALFIFGVWLLLFALQRLAQRNFSRPRWVHIGCIVAACAGLYFTYLDFRHTLSHRLLGERFHLGGYLFWLGWILISLFYLGNRTSKPKATGQAADRAVQH